MTDEGNGLTLDFARSGRNGSGTLTARLNGEILLVDKLDVAKQSARQKIIGQLCNGRPGIDRRAVGEELMKLAATIVPRAGSDAPGGGEDEEVDVSRIVRPERFIADEVSGLAVPTMTRMGDQLVGRWKLYLQWSDSRRECRAVSPTIELSQKEKLWVHPQPSPPTVNTRAA